MNMFEQDAEERYPLSASDEWKTVSLTRESFVMQLRSAFMAGTEAAASRMEVSA